MHRPSAKNMRIKIIRKKVFYSLVLAGSIYLLLTLTLGTINTDDTQHHSATREDQRNPDWLMDNKKAFDPARWIGANLSNSSQVDASKLYLDIPVLPLDVLLKKKPAKLKPKFGTHNQPYLRIASDGYVSVPGCSSPIPRPFDLGAEPTPEWQTVKSNLSYVFSAFADYYEGDHQTLKLIGIRRVNSLPSSTTCLCRLWYGRAELPEVVDGAIKVIPEGEWPDEYRAVVFECPLSEEVPYAVSLVHDECESSKNVLFVNVLKPSQTPSKAQSDFTCCVPPLHSKFNNVVAVVEWIETNILLGADQFIFYNHSIGPKLDVVLHQYEAEGKVMMIPWTDIPVRVSPFLRNLSDAQILYFGQSAAINDCLYRSVGQTTYTVFMDTDEFIFPRQHQSWIEMIEHVEFSKKHQQVTGMYWIQNSFMEKHLPGDPETLSSLHLVGDFTEMKSKSELLPYLNTMVFNKRRNFLWSYKYRTKMIVIPERIEQIGIHYVHQFKPGCNIVKVRPEVAILQHYRHMKNDTDNFVIDLTAQAYKDDILDRVWQRLSLLTDIS